ncbi:hypothetical protein LINGRAHAP2_LOCUS24431 [Linum grandiflorum]
MLVIDLRSKELFHSIGDLCGGFLEYDIPNWFKDGIRIKILVRKEIPDDIVLKYKENLFPVTVVTEPSPLTMKTTAMWLDQSVSHAIPPINFPLSNYSLPLHKEVEHASPSNNKVDVSGESVSKSNACGSKDVVRIDGVLVDYISASNCFNLVMDLTPAFCEAADKTGEEDAVIAEGSLSEAAD